MTSKCLFKRQDSDQHLFQGGWVVSRSISLLSPLVIPGLRTLSRLCSKKIKEAVVKLLVNSWNLDG